ncbi:hypothetical protein [Streptomyces lavendulocolor]|uniref:hypothetical protein n=1 Tax=Streptomyces lavendulocolor TaxID=67316 RepID=UPI0031DE35BF
MSDRPRLEEALDILSAELAMGRSTTTGLTTKAAWLAYTRFGRQRFETAATPDSDGLLFQYGTYVFSGRPMFTVDLTRQFGISAADGEYDRYVQVHCELRYEPELALDALGRFDSWFFHDTEADLDQWFATMQGHLEPLLERVPSAMAVYEEPV